MIRISLFTFKGMLRSGSVYSHSKACYDQDLSIHIQKSMFLFLTILKTKTVVNEKIKLSLTIMKTI